MLALLHVVIIIRAGITAIGIVKLHLAFGGPKIFVICLELSTWMQWREHMAYDVSEHGSKLDLSLSYLVCV